MAQGFGAQGLDEDDRLDDRPGLEDIDTFDGDDDEDDDEDDFDDPDDGDDDEDEEDDGDEDVYDDLEDADDDEIDFVVALYREDGELTGIALEPDLANDFEELIAQLQRVPGDAGALGLVSLDSEVLVAARVRGPRHIQVMISDIYYADVWPLVRDAADFLGIDPDDDDTPEEGIVGDLSLFADQGLPEMNLTALTMEDDELSSEDLAGRIAKAIHFEPQFRKAVDDYWSSDE
ncbi:MAG: tRNA adenosine deaminase [Propionibacteriaceae bacterium]|jgi:putative tRNA adenosine deaminase-associated protein|nr:tRNA adenosine deaminase [Propionibacteriaceae bacterium]